MVDHEKTTRHAIAVMTAWAEDGPPAAGEVIASYVSESADGEMYLMLGFENLCGILLVKLAEERGQSMSEVLQEIAVKYQ